jgi:hypothetical protein
MPTCDRPSGKENPNFVTGLQGIAACYCLGAGAKSAIICIISTLLEFGLKAQTEAKHG